MIMLEGTHQDSPEELIYITWTGRPYELSTSPK